jgi:hypothetical protein
MRACGIDAARGQQTNLKPSLRDGQSIARPCAWSNTDAQLRYVRLMALFVKGQPDRECHILDVSTHGAKITVQAPSQVPARFELAIFRNDEKRRLCKVLGDGARCWMLNSFRKLVSLGAMGHVAALECRSRP